LLQLTALAWVIRKALTKPKVQAGRGPGEGNAGCGAAVSVDMMGR
jgi:hypothetical protein